MSNDSSAPAAAVSDADLAALEARITELWERRAELSPDDKDARKFVRSVIDLLDTGRVRVAEVVGDDVVVHAWLKQAILLLFRLSKMKTVELPPFEFVDKVPLKKGLGGLGIRVLPGASARYGSFLEPGVVLMPSYVNIGARVGANTMVDTWATVGSCAQIGANVHLSGGVGIGGVLEPPQAAPVIVEDDCFIGSRCIVAEGARVGRNSVLGAGCILTGSVPVIDAWSGNEISRGVVPPNSLAVSATRARRFGEHEFGLPCVLVIRTLDPETRHDKTGLEAILRDHGTAL
jgi:2,3,4,5-tetrahydropyridine-2-carboxylate N-succinyltransferase